MRPGGGDGSIKELPPLHWNMHLIDSSDLTQKREMGNWKMAEEDWKQCADYKLRKETKGAFLLARR